MTRKEDQAQQLGKGIAALHEYTKMLDAITNHQPGVSKDDAVAAGRRLQESAQELGDDLGIIQGVQEVINNLTK